MRDLRVRWALEEAGLPYRVESTSFRDRGPDHFAAQPFGQVPWLTDGDLTIFESGAILLHLGEKMPVLMPTDPRGRSEVVEWVIAALNSVDLPAQSWALFRFMGFSGETPEAKFVDDFLKARLDRMEAVLIGGEWLVADRFTVADLLMGDVLRQVNRFDGLTKFPACHAYVARMTARPAFVKAYDDQMAHFAATDEINSRCADISPLLLYLRLAAKELNRRQVLTGSQSHLIVSYVGETQQPCGEATMANSDPLQTFAATEVRPKRQPAASVP